MTKLCSEIDNSLAIFCMATYGEGDPTDNAQEFYEWLQTDVDLQGLRYACGSTCLAPFLSVALPDKQGRLELQVKKS